MLQSRTGPLSAADYRTRPGSRRRTRTGRTVRPTRTGAAQYVAAKLKLFVKNDVKHQKLKKNLKKPGMNITTLF